MLLVRRSVPAASKVIRGRRRKTQNRKHYAKGKPESFKVVTPPL